MAGIKIVVDGIPGADGEYELDPADSFNNRELHTIKQIAGVRMGEMEDALDAGDNDLLVAFTAIVLTRAGKTVPVDALWDAPAGAVKFVVPKVEADAVPPAQRLPEPPEKQTEQPQHSGEDSTRTGGLPASVLRLTGTQD